jgi:hypothetical protein
LPEYRYNLSAIIKKIILIAIILSSRGKIQIIIAFVTVSNYAYDSSVTGHFLKALRLAS